MKKQILILGLLIGFISIHQTSVAQETYPSLGYFPDFRVPIEYEVQAGESLSSLAYRFHISQNAIKKANLKLAMRDQLQLGEIIKIFPPQVKGLKAPQGSTQYTSPKPNNTAQNTTSTTATQNKQKVFYVEYKIQQGDTLYRIGRKFKTNVEYIRRANLKLSMSDHIEPGQIIKVPIVKQ